MVAPADKSQFYYKLPFTNEQECECKIVILNELSLVNVDGIMRILYILETKTYIALEFRSLRTLVSKKMHLITYFDLLNEQTEKKGKFFINFSFHK